MKDDNGRMLGRFVDGDNVFCGLALLGVMLLLSLMEIPGLVRDCFRTQPLYLR